MYSTSVGTISSSQRRSTNFCTRALSIIGSSMPNEGAACCPAQAELAMVLRITVVLRDLNSMTGYDCWSIGLDGGSHGWCRHGCVQRRSLDRLADHIVLDPVPGNQDRAEG